ncbi:MAG: T9SS type A sorting domain-containing protein [Ignavibacteria bacterium]|nr:T9SS type A sorting domain-containing protein [Ignavibacteria bacterium]
MLFLLSVFCCLFIVKSATYAQISFTPLPAQPQDHVLSITINPITATMYCCTSTRVSQSSDNGVTWSKTANTGALGINILYCTPKGQLYAGVDATTGSTPVGLVSYNASTSDWSPVSGSPLSITSIIEDNAGNLIVGTGSTGNFNPNPITYGKGFFLYNGSTWTEINSGVPMLSGYNVFPAVKALSHDKAGTIFAATYGAGVLQYKNGLWTALGNGLPNLNISSLLVKNDGTVVAGMDNGVSFLKSTTWVNESDGLPNKPVRALVVDSTGKIFAGLGFYQWMDGSLKGEVYATSDNGISWINFNQGLVTSDILCMYVGSTHTVFAGAAGIWKSPISTATWSNIQSALVGVNQTSRIVRNSKGVLFTICDNQPKYYGYGGVFRSTDGGASWTQILNGINRHRGNFVFCDSKDNLWAGCTTLNGTASNGSHTGGTLYKSTDNGESWHQNTSILSPTLRFSGMQESPSGKLYIINGWGGPSNISSSTDFEAWDNSLNGGADNGGMAFGLAINSKNDVFVGTETNGVMRSLNDGNDPFISVTPKGGNNSVFIDRQTDFMFGGIPGDASGIYLRGSQPSDNGSNSFVFKNFPPYTGPTAMAYDNRGNAYLSANSGSFANSGFYILPSPWDSNSQFTKIMANANVSYYFTSLLVDPCGYLYGAQAGAGIYVSTAPVNLPEPPIIQSPMDGAIIPLPVTLQWSLPCTLDSIEVQISTDILFSTIEFDTVVLKDNITPTTLKANSKYYWRLRSSNSLGQSKWSPPYTFKTGTVGVLEYDESESSINCRYLPNSHTITVNVPSHLSGTSYSIFNILGQLIRTNTLQFGNTIISTESLQNGLFFLKMYGNQTFCFMVGN